MSTSPAVPAAINSSRECMAELKLERRIVLRTQHYLSIPMLVANSDMIAVVPRAVGRAFAGVANLKLVEPPVQVPHIEVKQFWHRRAHNEPGIVWMRKLLAQLFLHRDPSRRSAVAHLRRQAAAASRSRLPIAAPRSPRPTRRSAARKTAPGSGDRYRSDSTRAWRRNSPCPGLTARRRCQPLVLSRLAVGGEHVRHAVAQIDMAVAVVVDAVLDVGRRQENCVWPISPA